MYVNKACRWNSQNRAYGIELIISLHGHRKYLLAIVNHPAHKYSTDIQ